MSGPILGLHHVTAIARDPQQNVDFYTKALGLRLVKRTVNFDSPETYHLYFGDEQGRPGTIMTFFPWPMAARGSRGAGQAAVTSFSVPPGSLPAWQRRLRDLGVVVEQPYERFDEEVLTILDPDGLMLELVAHEDVAEQPGWPQGPVDETEAIRGFHSVTLWQQGYEATAELLTDGMGFRQTHSADNRFRFEVGDGGLGTLVDVLCVPDASYGRISAGTVHHVAWRAADDADQAAWRERLSGRGLNVTPVLDRNYFRSIYFREPGGVLFELATDPPGFTADEPVETLGTELKLPSWLEPRRQRIEGALPPLVVDSKG
ncbi:MAG: ring-cleaving dioxygenase [Acidobacteriota bacterium]